MKLYHGTTERYLSAILSEGIKPRQGRPGNWGHSVSSNAGCVYLTECYAPYFAIHAVGDTDDRACIVEIDTDKLIQGLIYPDEDFLEQVSRGQTCAGWSKSKNMKRRTVYYRERLGRYSHLWEHSVKGLGNCCYNGTIPVTSITRYSVYDILQNMEMTYMCMDPSISLLNHRFCANKYRSITKWYMGGEVSPVNIDASFSCLDDTLVEGAMDLLRIEQQHLTEVLANRNGIEVYMM